MKFERAVLTQPQERRQIVGEDVVLLLTLVPGEHRHRLDEVRHALLPVLLKEALAVDPLGHANHRQRPILQMRQHETRHGGEVTDQIPLGDRRTPRTPVGGPIDALQIRQADARAAHRQVQAIRVVVELLQDRARLARRWRVPPGFGRPGRRAVAHAARLDVVPQPDEHGGAQQPLGGPLGEADFDNPLGLEPGGGPVQRRRRTER